MKEVTPASKNISNENSFSNSSNDSVKGGKGGAALCHIKVFNMIMDKAEEKNPDNNQGMTPFYTAARYGKLKISKMIMKHIVNRNPRCNNCRTQLHHAAEKSNLVKSNNVS